MTAISDDKYTSSPERSQSPSLNSQEPYDDKVPVDNPVYLDVDEVQWQYLTYETPIPDFTALNNDPSAPQPPQLKSYDSPFEWSPLRKNTCLALSCVATFLAGYIAGAYPFAAIPLRAKWGISAVSYSTGVTAFCLGFGVSPMFLAPFSEINGRRPIFLASGLVFLVADIGCAVTNSFPGMIIARFFVGAGASTFSTMVGGVISDVYHAEHRNTPMAIYSGFVLAGSGLGPMFAGFIVERANWRWIFYSHAIVLGVLLMCLIVLFKETRGSVLLSRRAKKINKYCNEIEAYSIQTYPNQKTPSKNIRYKVAADENRATIGRMIYLSLTTPFKFLATEPVVFFFSLYAAFAWGILYMAFSVIPLVYKTTYGFSVTQQAAVFAAIVVGALIATVLSVYQDTLIALTPFGKTASGEPKPHTPEARLYLPCLISPLLPIGLFWFGWASNYSSVPWIVPTIGLAASGIGIFSIYLAVFNYLADTYHRYASSALAGQSFCRNVLAAAFPLFSDQMFRRLGFGGAGCLLGGIGLLLTLVPWVLVWKGEVIRGKSKVASEIMQGKQ